MIITSLAGAFLVCLTIQLFYYLFFFSRLAFRKNDQGVKDKNTPSEPVSILICAYNEAENLKDLLPVLYEQNFDQYEIIVIDDKSTDETRAFLYREKEENKKLKVITIDHTPSHINNKKYALILGIKTAKYDKILLTDADCVPADKDWIKSMTRALNNSSTKIVLGFSQYLSGNGLLNAFIRFETIYTAIQYLSRAIGGNPYMGVGRNLAYSKSFFLDRKGFGSYLKVTGGDDDLFVNKNATKQNTEIAIGKKSLVYSKPKVSWKEFFHQKKRHLSVGKYYNFKDKVFLGLLFVSHLLFWVLFLTLLVIWEEPYLAIGGFVLKMALQYLIFYKAGQRLGDKIKLGMLPLLDVLYVMYYIATGISAIASRDIKWN